MQSGWRCEQCGPLGEPELSIYREELFNTQSRRFGPWCARCGARALYRGDRRTTARATGAGARPRVVVLSGTCASGKSTVSYEMSTRHDFTQIDGDWILDLRKKELGHRPELTEIDGEMLGMAEGMVALGRSVVIAHVVLPATFGYYHDYFGERGVEHRIVVLMPRERVVLDRNRERKCWPKTTPEYWVQKFRQDFLDAGDAVTGYLYDNSDETPAETAGRLAGLWEAERRTKEES